MPIDAIEMGAPGPDTRKVIFNWSTHLGECYDCGIPAAFYRGDDPDDPSNRLCAVCAANDAASGETIHRIEEDEEEQEVIF